MLNLINLIEGFAFYLAKLLHDQSVPVLLLLTVLALFSTRKRTAFLAALTIVLILVPVMKDWYQGYRPCFFFDSIEICPLTLGFPSSHAAVAGVFTVASLATWSNFFFLPLALFTMWSRIALGMHTTHQTIAGFAFGLVVYVVVEACFKKFWKDRYD